MAWDTYRRGAFGTLLARLREPRRFIQVLAGPRQAGKTTLAHQALAELELPSHYASADEPGGRDRAWLEAQWAIGRTLSAGGGTKGAILVLDEVQKIAAWSDLVKLLWDQDSAASSRLRVVLLGSAPLLIQRGLGDSLAGRFELIRVPHWSFPEMREAFDWDLDRYVYFGGYPGSAGLIKDRQRWTSYILDSLVETSVSRDILLLTRVDKPALLRQLFRLACDYSGQILSFSKMLGQLQDAGNTTTLAHHLELLGGAGLVVGLQKFSGSRVRQRGSSPKLLALNSALVSAHLDLSLSAARKQPEVWGRLVETAVGAHLVNTAGGSGVEVLYWRERNREVDLVLRRGGTLVALEVTSGRRKDSLPGFEAFRREHPKAKPLLVGGQGVPLAEFLSEPADRWVR